MAMTDQAQGPVITPPVAPSASSPSRPGLEWLALGPRAGGSSVDLFGSLVRDIMTTHVVTIGPNDSLRTAATVLIEKKFSGLPVVDSEGKVVGVLSEKDIVRQLGEKVGLSVPGGLFELILEPSAARRSDLLARCAATLNQVLVADAMSKPARTTHPDVATVEAIREMLLFRINRLPVVENGRLVGLLTRSDVFRLAPGN